MTGRVEDYIGLARWAVRDITFIPGADRDDLHQEAMIGCLEALRDHDPARGSLESFVVLCARRHVIDVVKAANRRQRRFLTDAIRWALDEDGNVVDVFENATDGLSAEDAALLHLELRDLLDRIDGDLSPIERRSVIGLTLGATCAELGGPPKAIDNAVYRARRKLAA